MKAVKLPSGNYRCRVEIGKSADGHRQWKSFTGPNKRLVEAQASAFALANKNAESGSFARYSQAYLRSRAATASPATIRSYIAVDKRLRSYPWFYEMNVSAISQDDIQELIDELTEDLSPKTVRNYWGYIHAILDGAGVVTRSPWLPQRRRTALNIPDEETVMRVIKLAEGTDLEVPIMLAAFGPLRRGEICGLTLDDIKGNRIHVRRDVVKNSDGEWVTKPPKTESSDRYIDMPPKVIAIIKKQGYVYKHNPNVLTDQFRKLLKRNGIEHFRFHDLRHFCCSYLHAMNVADVYIMQRTGHATNATLRNVYTHTLQNQSKTETARIIERFDAMA